MHTTPHLFVPKPKYRRMSTSGSIVLWFFFWWILLPVYVFYAAALLLVFVAGNLFTLILVPAIALLSHATVIAVAWTYRSALQLRGH